MTQANTMVIKENDKYILIDLKTEKDLHQFDTYDQARDFYIKLPN